MPTVSVIMPVYNVAPYLEEAIESVLAQYPATDGAIGTADGWRRLAERAHAAGALVVLATDLLALTVLTPPGELEAEPFHRGELINSGGRIGHPADRPQASQPHHIDGARPHLP